ncbi:MAG: 2-oxo acid dehydrogenase subunit E2, partial [bacterium]
ASPSAKKLAAEKGVDLAAVTGSGKGGRITKEDVEAYTPAASASTAPASAPAAPAPAATETSAVPPELLGSRVEKRVPMTRMRARIAERLLSVVQSTAMLTTFNEVDMHRIMNLRSEYKDQFSKIHNGTRLGFMGFFVKAAVEALKRYPSVNASIDGSDIVYHGYQDVGVAVSTERGLVVPVLRNAELMSIADIESGIAEFGAKAKENKLSIEDMTGGTFSISNGGVFGSMLSTPILNPPMMYLALSYDHRLIDGKEAVGFLVAIKEMIENPAKILLEI